MKVISAQVELKWKNQSKHLIVAMYAQLENTVPQGLLLNNCVQAAITIIGEDLLHACHAQLDIIVQVEQDNPLFVQPECIVEQ